MHNYNWYAYASSHGFNMLCMVPIIWYMLISALMVSDHLYSPMVSDNFEVQVYLQVFFSIKKSFCQRINM